MRLALIALFSLMCVSLLAETIALPDVNISVESPIKAFVYKKAITTPQDSLKLNLSPRLLPTLNPQINYGSIMPYYPPVLLSLSARLSAHLDQELSLNYYPRDIPIKSLSYALERVIKENGRNYFFMQTGVSGTFDTHDLSTELIFHKANNQGDKNELFSLIFTHAADSLTDKGYTIHSPMTRLGVSHVTGNSGALYVEHSNWFDLWQSRANFHYLTQSAAHVVDIDFLLPYDIPIIERATVGLMSDFGNLIPYVKYNKRIVLSPGKTLSISNTPFVSNELLYPVTYCSPYIGFADKHRMTLTPFAQRFAYSVIPNVAGLPMLKSIYASYDMGYTFNSVIQAYDPSSSSPVMSYRDVFSNVISFGISAKLKNLSIKQDADISLLSLPERNWRRVPYKGLFNLSTTMEMTLEKLSLNLRFNQSYNRVDHNYRHLKELVLLDINANYQLCSRVYLYASVKNLLDTDDSYWRDIPFGKRDMQLGFRFMLRR